MVAKAPRPGARRSAVAPEVLGDGERHQPDTGDLRKLTDVSQQSSAIKRLTVHLHQQAT